MEHSKSPLVLFHDECVDGIVAAWIAWRRFFDNAEYRAVQYGQPAPEDVEGRLVYILDFAYAPEQTLQMAELATRVIVLDHHPTAIERFAAWQDHPRVELHFDLERSGAGLTSEYFNAKTSIWIVDYAEDRDLWKFALPDSRAINALIAATCLGRKPIDAFRALNELRGKSLKQAALEGAGAELQIECYGRQCAQAARKIRFAGADGIPVVNIARPMNSDVLHLLDHGVPFAVGWYQVGDTVVFSLRSAKDTGADVAKICERFGGGGHKHAAGFRLAADGLQYFLRGEIGPGHDPTELP